MLAIDTNVVVRFLAADHPSQSKTAKRLVESQEVFVATTVLLETEWVLRSAYKLSRAVIHDRLMAFAGLGNVTLENTSRMRRALDLMAAGLDFADALHLSAAGDCDAFITFDQRLQRAAATSDSIVVRAP